MKLAAIDIGSNAIRLQIVTVYEQKEMVSFKKLEYLRFPLRLGQDVFKKGKISDPVLEKYTKLLMTFKLLIELYEADASFAVATSAMREATNGAEVRDYLKEKSGIDINIIYGTEEANILNKAIIPYLGEGNSIHIDVGGGSTELNLYEGKTLIDSKSFNIGSVRKLSVKDRAKIFADINLWVKKSNFSRNKNVFGIGTGGNINKLSKLSRKKNESSLSLVELKAIRAYVNEYSYEERMSKLKMDHDRADVIIPASEIYIRALESVGADSILVPDVGLKDGIIYELYERTTHKDIYNLEYLEEF
jgi:exopolyphosphatase/guanosine-5'-triphosphate,3'-diphosphate pyrophosphatase